MKKHVVYKLTNTQTGGVYIGVTNNLKRRLWEHKSRSNVLSETNRNIKLYQDMHEYGMELFDVNILEEVNPEDRYEKEQYYIKKYDALSEPNYNNIQSLDLLNNININEIVTAFKNGESASQIGKKYGVKHPQITELLKKNMNINEYKKLMEKHTNPHKNISIKEIVRLIEEEGKSKKETAKILGVCDSTVVRRYNNWKKKQDPNFNINPHGLGAKKVDSKLIIETYLKVKSTRKTEKITGYSRSTVRKYLKIEGIL